ncbi:MAG: type IV pilus biogenesis/stability protein PilW [Xanthomonadales bacterium]|nr:type IV pilus biogenesis/stability protein PilW [Xanthomonadales bacterium]
MKTWMVLTLSTLLMACASSGPIPEQGKESVEGAIVNVKLATGYIQQGDYEVALDKLKRALEFDPNYATAHTVIGVLYGRIGKLELAGKHYKRATELNPHDGGVLNNYGQYLCQTQQYDAAFPYFERALEEPFYHTPESALANAGRCAIDQGDLEKAELYLRRALKKSPGYPPTLLDLAELMKLRGDNLKARAFLERFHATRQVSAQSLYMGYDIESKLGDTKASQEYRRKLIQQFPDSALTNSIL